MRGRIPTAMKTMMVKLFEQGISLSQIASEVDRPEATVAKILGQVPPEVQGGGKDLTVYNVDLSSKPGYKLKLPNTMTKKDLLLLQSFLETHYERVNPSEAVYTEVEVWEAISDEVSLTATDEAEEVEEARVL